MEETLKAVAYYRYSSTQQSENSIAYQREHVERYCRANNITVVKEYIDEAKSGKAESIPKRNGYIQMLNDLEKRNVDAQALILFKFDRLGRDMAESIGCYSKLTKMGYRLMCSEGGIDTANNIADLLVALNAAMAQMEDTNISIRTRNGNVTAAQKGQHMGKTIPLGYKVADKRFIIDEDNAQIIKTIFDLFIQGKTTHAICDYLNERGFKTGLGHSFRHQTIAYILHNEHYCGTYIYNSGLPEIGQIRIENNHPAIIDYDTFKTAQSILAKNKRAAKSVDNSRPVRERYLLTGKIFCGECGSTMQGYSGTSRNHTKKCYYACKGRREKNGCIKANHPRDELESFVVNNCLALISGHKNLAKEIHKIYLQKYGEAGDSQLLRQLEKLNTEYTNYAKMLSDPDVLKRPILKDTYLKQMDTIEMQMSDLKRQLNETDKLKGSIPTVDDIKKWLKKFSAIDTSELSKEQMQHIIDTFIRAVYVTDDNIIIFYNVDGNPDPSPTSYTDYKDAVSEYEKSTNSVESLQSRGAKVVLT